MFCNANRARSGGEVIYDRAIDGDEPLVRATETSGAPIATTQEGDVKTTTRTEVIRGKKLG